MSRPEFIRHSSSYQFYNLGMLIEDSDRGISASENKAVKKEADLSTYVKGVETACEAWEDPAHPGRKCAVSLDDLVFRKVDIELPHAKSGEPQTRQVDRLGGQSLFLAVTPETLLNPDPVLFVNGLVKNSKGFKSSIQRVADELGRPVIGIVNNQSDTVLGDVQNAIASVLSVDEGSRAEPEAVNGLVSMLSSLLSTGKEVEVIGYSQGGAIVQNALYKLKESEPELWAQAANKIKVNTWGINMNLWPDGPKVKEYNFTRNDPVTAITAVASEVKRFGVKILRGIENIFGLDFGNLERYDGSRRGNYIDLDSGQDGFLHNLGAYAKAFADRN